MSNYTDLIASATESGVTAVTVAQGMAAAEQAMADYPTRCAQTVIVYATVEDKVMTRAAIARDAGISAMQVGRYYAAGQILAAHGDLDPVAVVTYANTHDKDECKAVAAMSEDEAAAAIKPAKATGSNGSKSEAEKDQEALTRLISRIRKAGESGDAERLAILDNALTTILPDAIAAAWGEAETEGEATGTE
jgi:hypothetical protein